VLLDLESDPIKLYHAIKQYAGSPGIRAHCYTELAVSSPVVVKTIITSTHLTYPLRDGQAEWA